MFLQGGITQHFIGSFDGGGLAFDVREDRDDLRHIVTNFGLKHGDAVMGLFQAEAFIQFQVLLDVEISLQILHADIVDVEVVARRYRADAVENIFGAHGAGGR